MRVPSAVIAASAILIAALPARADTIQSFAWSYSGSGVSGSGTLDASYPGSGVTYTLTSISGTANGLNIVGPSSYDSPDQLLFSPSPPNIALDTLGISFSVVGGQSFNIYEDDGLYSPGAPYGCGGVYCLLGPGTVGAGDPFVTVTFSLTPTPLPAALPLFATGLGAMGLFGWRRKRRARAVVA